MSEYDVIACATFFSYHFCSPSGGKMIVASLQEISIGSRMDHSAALDGNELNRINCVDCS